MEAKPPVINLVVIRSADIHRAVTFYEKLGLTFALHAHGTGPEHYACDCQECVFELYPQKSPAQSTASTRLGFRVLDLEAVIGELRQINVTIVSEPSDSEWGRRAVVKDFDGHSVDLVQQ